MAYTYRRLKLGDSSSLDQAANSIGVGGASDDPYVSASISYSNGYECIEMFGFMVPPGDKTALKNRLEQVARFQQFMAAWVNNVQKEFDKLSVKVAPKKVTKVKSKRVTEPILMGAVE